MRASSSDSKARNGARPDDGLEEGQLQRPSVGESAQGESGSAGEGAAGAVDPKIYFTYPPEGAVLGASEAAISIDVDPPGFDLAARDMVMCIEILFRHGRQRNCFDGTPELNLGGLESGQILAIATLEMNSTGEEDGDEELMDSNSDGMISKCEFLSILENPDAARALQHVGVDPVEIVEYVDFTLNLRNLL